MSETPDSPPQEQAKTAPPPPPPLLPRMVVGLGNPGRKYEGTRHNIGFDLLDRLASEAGISFKNELRHQALVARTDSGIFFVKPQTFMNESGRSTSSIARFYKIEPEEILIAYDDVALPLGSLRFRASGSAGGHNGIKSLISHYNTQTIPRLKIGVGNSEPGALVGHVLGKFRPSEREEVENTLATAAKAVQLALSQGREAAANVYNVRKPLSDTHTDEP